MSKMRNYFVDVRQDLVYASVKPSRPVQTILKTSPVASIPLNSIIIMCYSKLFFGWSGFLLQKCQFFWWTSIKTMSMHPVGSHGMSDQFWRSNEPRSEHNPHFDDFRVLELTNFWVIRIPTSKMPNNFVDVRQDLFYVSGWPSRPVQPILKVKQAQSEHTPHFDDFRVL